MAKGFNLEEYKKTLKIPPRIEKKARYVEVSPEIQACIGGLPGPPLGDITEIWGDSDTGKTTLLMEIGVACQQQNILPVLIIKEKKHRESRLALMGFDKDNAIINLACTNLEEMFQFIDKIIADVNKGRLPTDVMFLVDSFGNANCKAALKINEDGTTESKNVHMQNAKVFSEKITVTADRINDTRYDVTPHFISMVWVNHIYEKPIKVGNKTFTKLQPRGGKKRKYVASLELSMKRVKSIKAIVNKIPLDFGFITKLSVEKNHVNGVYNSGKLIITEDEIFANHKSAIDDYKKRHREKWGEVTEFMMVNEEDEDDSTSED